jgi:hypothetical protein
MAIYDSFITLSSCTFHSNWAVRHGAGVYIYRGSLALIGCSFHGNVARVSVNESTPLQHINTLLLFSFYSDTYIYGCMFKC